MRTIPALAISTVLLATLTACTGGPFDSACTPLATSGPASSLIDASGPVGTAPTVDFPTPLFGDGIEAEPLTKGDGRTVHTGDTIAIKYSLFNGTTGQTLGSSGYTHTGDLTTLGSVGAGEVISDSLECATVGSRVAVVADALAVHGGQGNPSAGVGPNDSIIYVIDVVDAYPAHATGAPQLARAGMPAVVTAPNGAPGITIPRIDAPTQVEVAALRIGDGDELDASDRVLAKFTAVAWETGDVVNSTWSNGQGTIIPLDGTSQLPAAVVDAIIGSTLGSQVLVVVPAGDNAAGSGNTLVYVVDLLGIIPADS